MLEIADLSVYYGRIRALNHASLRVKRGEIVTLIGANGAGKTTLLSAISGVVLSSGAILYKCENIQKKDAAARVEMGLAQVPEGRQLFNELDVETNLKVGGSVRSRKELMASLEEIYEIFPDLKNKKRDLAGNLSGGQQQMVSIGRALMSKPEMLLLDEPSMGLAPILVQGVWKVIVELQRRGMGILLVEQNAHMALSIADRGYVIQNGEIVMEESAEHLRSSKLVQELYLGGLQ